MTAPEPTVMPPCMYMPPLTPLEQLPTAYRPSMGLPPTLMTWALSLIFRPPQVPQVPGTYTAP